MAEPREPYNAGGKESITPPPAGDAWANRTQGFESPGRRAAAPISPSLQVDQAIGRAWGGAWELVQSDAAALFVGGVLAAIVSSVTLGILSGPLVWGMLAMCWKRMRRGEAMEAMEAFRHFERAGTSIGIAVLGGIAVTIGLFLLIVPGLYLAVAFMYALPLGFDRKLGVVDSLKESRALVHQSGFWVHALLAASMVIPGAVLGGLLFGVVGWLWFPFAVAILAVAYDAFIRPLSSKPIIPH